MDVEDGGRFNYHINELRDLFVQRDEGRYWLTTAGSRVVDEIYALTRPPTIAFLHDHGIDYRTLELEYGSTSWNCKSEDSTMAFWFDSQSTTTSSKSNSIARYIPSRTDVRRWPRSVDVFRGSYPIRNRISGCLMHNRYWNQS